MIVYYISGLILPLLIEVAVLSQESGVSCICALGASILPLSNTFLLDFGNVPNVWYFLIFCFILFVLRKHVWMNSNRQYSKQ